MPEIADSSVRRVRTPVVPPPIAAGETRGAVADILRRYEDEAGGPRRARHPIAPPQALRAAVEVPLEGGAGLYLSKSGHLIVRPGQERPANTLELGDVLFRAASAADDEIAFFKDPRIVLAQKEAALASLTGTS